MFAALTAIALFITLAWLENSFLDHILEAARNSPTPSWPNQPLPSPPDHPTAAPLPQDS